MGKLNKILIILLILVLVAILGIGGYLIYNLNNKIKLLSFKDNYTENTLIIEDNIVTESSIDNVISNQVTNQTIPVDTNTNTEINITSKKISLEDIVTELFLKQIKENDSKNSEKLLDYRVDKVSILSDEERQSMTAYKSTDILAIVTYSVKPQNVNASNWMSGNGEIKGDWIINKTAYVCISLTSGTSW